MQPLRFLMLEPLERLEADLEMLTNALAIKFAGHASKLDLAVKRLVRDAEQSAVGDAEAVAVGRDRRRLHVERNGARLRQPPDNGRTADLPIAVVDARHRS